MAQRGNLTGKPQKHRAPQLCLAFHATLRHVQSAQRRPEQRRTSGRAARGPGAAAEPPPSGHPPLTARGPGPSGGGRAEGSNPACSNALASPTHSCKLDDSPACLRKQFNPLYTPETEQAQALPQKARQRIGI